MKYRGFPMRIARLDILLIAFAMACQLSACAKGGLATETRHELNQVSDCLRSRCDKVTVNNHFKEADMKCLIDTVGKGNVESVSRINSATLGRNVKVVALIPALECSQSIIAVAIVTKDGGLVRADIGIQLD